MDLASGDRRWSVHTPIPGLDLAMTAMEGAVIAIVAGDVDAAQQLLALANRADVRVHFAVIAGPVRDSRPKRVQKPAHGIPMPRVAVRRAVYARDGWRCRFCQTRLIDPEAAARLRRLSPDAFHWGTRNADRHSVLLALRATPDHVLPRCCGGTNDLDNLVTACGCCQFGRGDATLEQLGISGIRPAVDDNWDGLRRVL
jgi:hypothetical protein